MHYFQGILNKKSFIYSIILVSILGLYYFYISTITEINETENTVVLTELGICFFVTLFNFKIKEKNKYYFNYIYVLILSIYTGLILDFFNGTFENAFEDTLNSILIKFFTSLLIAFLIYLLLIAIFKDMKTACIVGFVITILFGFVGYIILEFRGSRLLFADLLSFETALDVSGSYTVIPVRKPLLLGFLSIFCTIPTLYKMYKVKISYLSVKRLVCYLIFTFSFFGLYHSNINKYFYSWAESENPYLYSFFSNLKFMELKPDKSYDKEEVISLIEEAKPASFLPAGFNPDAEIMEEFPDYVEKNHTTNPNIIVIMNESLTDIDTFGETNTKNYVFSFMNSLTNVIKGNTYVDIRGGGTSDSEYDFLTGNSTYILPLNARPYQFYVNEDSLNLVTYLDDLNYHTVAIHPGNPISWNRANVYRQQFNFDETIFEDQFDFINYVRNPFLKSDGATYMKIIDKYMNDHTSPYFIFDVTIQNHGSYSSEYTNLEKIQLPGNYPDEVVQFLSLMRRSDQDFGTLVNYFKDLDEPTVILMFGDHQPKFTAEFPSYVNDKDLSNEELQSLYRTPYVIWANYTLPKQANIDLSLNYLSSLLLECAGLEKPEINNYLVNFSKKIKAINRNGFITNKNEFYSFKDDIPEEYEELIEEFKNFSYYNIIEQKESDFSP